MRISISLKSNTDFLKVRLIFWFKVSYCKVTLTLIAFSATRVYVHLTEKWKGKVRGLCGNYDEDSTNEFISRSNSLERVPSAFANSWKVYNCPLVPQDKPENSIHPCTVSILCKRF